jgi:hypothetical protein
MTYSSPGFVPKSRERETSECKGESEVLYGGTQYKKVGSCCLIPS